MPTAAQYAERLARGDCPRCGRPKLPEWKTYLCVDCNSGALEANRKWRRRNKAKVRRYDARANAKRLTAARDGGRCIACGGKAAKGVLRCAPCQRYSSGLTAQRRAATSAAIAAAIWLLGGGCAPRPQAVEPPAAPTPFCFLAIAKFDGREQVAQGCFETAALCGNAQRRAVRLGGLAGVTEVGQCRFGTP